MLIVVLQWLSCLSKIKDRLKQNTAPFKTKQTICYGAFMLVDENCVRMSEKKKIKILGGSNTRCAFYVSSSKFPSLYYFILIGGTCLITKPFVYGYKQNGWIILLKDKSKASFYLL